MKQRVARWERGGVDRVPQIIEGWSPTVFLASAVFWIALLTLATLWAWPFAVPLGIAVLLTLIGSYDLLQSRHTILRNFPLVGRLRYFLESLRPELRQYFVESDSEANPISREKRAVVYQRAKDTVDTLPFGTHRPVYGTGYEWVGHSLRTARPRSNSNRVWIGYDSCSQPYCASLFNISAMSYGALSGPAILAMNEGARLGDFYQNTGEGGVSPYHLRPGGDLVWQIGTGYFGCRAEDGNFDAEKFRERAAHPHIKMIELKLSQGAKPAHGGILPGGKVSKEIAMIRGVPEGKTVTSPPTHRTFDSPLGLLEFLAELRELSGGKPVGFKLCVGHPVEVASIVKAMQQSDLTPDFITVDGAEGGTGAAPLEFSNSVGMPLADGLTLLDNMLRGVGLRDRLRLIAAGKVTTGFHLLRLMALGADSCNGARAMMFAVGCIQALKCNTNRCPTGVTTQDPRYTRGLVVGDKAKRVATFHARTMESLVELTTAAGLEAPEDARPEHFFRRVSPSEVRHFGQLYPRLEAGALLSGQAGEPYATYFRNASTDTF